MGIKDFSSFFDSIDAACKGYVTAGQLHKFYESVYLSAISVDHIEAAIGHICGHNSTGHVTKAYFLDVLEELERRRSIEEQSYWDFQALDYNGSGRISLKDALLLFREFHGDRFSLYTWNKFLKSRDEPNSDVYFDEIRFWLCDYPSGEPATSEQISQEEERLEYKQRQYELAEIDSFGQLLDSQKEKEEYLDETNYQANRKYNKWKKQGLEAMLFDDGLDADDTEGQQRPQDTVTMSDLTNAMEIKYDQLRQKLLMEMATLSAALEGEKPEIFQQLARQERQLRREGQLENEILSLPGSNMMLSGTLHGMMGYVMTIETEFRAEISELQRNLKQQGKSDAEIDQFIQSEYQKRLDGDKTCGSALVKLQHRYKEEKDALLSYLRSGTGQTSLLMMSQYSRLSRQQYLLADEGDFVSAAMAVGLAERQQEYKSNRRSDIDRTRSDTLANLRLKNKKGRKQVRTTEGVLDTEQLIDKGLIDLQHELTALIVRKHMYEREGFISMLQGPDSSGFRTSAKKLAAEQRVKQLKTLRNKHRSWKGSNSAENSVLHKILLEATALYCETRMTELQQDGSKLTEDEVIECVLSDLQQRQEVEYEEKLRDIVNQTSAVGLIQLLKKENKLQVNEHFDNIAYVVLGTLEIGEDDKEYVTALEEKYHALREKVFIMALRDQHGTDWKRFTEDEKKKAILNKRKEEKKLRGQGQYDEMEELIGPKCKLLPTLRRLIGEEKPIFEERFKQQKISGVIQDESPDISLTTINILADLVPRYDNELEAMLTWLQSKDTKSLPLKTKRLLILHLKLEVFAAKMEDDFEVATLRVGLAERILASIHGRHPTDVTRQTQLARKRIQLRTRKLLQKDAFEKKSDKGSVPNSGDLTGWQVAYVCEMMRRHDDEREQLLHYLQDDNLEDLTEAAALMSDEEKKLRLAELHAKRRKLNLDESDDKEEMVCILEEAVAIRAVCKKLEMEKSSKKSVTMEEVTVTLLTELQEEEDREIAYVLEMIVNLEEDEIKDRLAQEVNARSLGTLGNVFVVLLQSEGKTHELELLKALDLKFESLQECLLVTCLMWKNGKQAWNKMSVKEKQQKITATKQQILDLLNAGDNIGLLEAVGDGSLDETVESIMGMTRTHLMFKFKSQSEEEGDVSETTENQADGKISPVIQLQKRLEEEKRNLQKRLKGLEEDYLGEKDQEIHLVRIRREGMLCNPEDQFMFVAIQVGLAERQSETGKPSLQHDRARYTKLAKYRMEMLTNMPKQKEQKDQVIKGKDKVTHMEAVIESMGRKHQNEAELFTKIIHVPVGQTVQDEIMSLSQQQRKEKLLALKSQRHATPLENWPAHEKLIHEGIAIKREIYRHRLNQNQKETVGDKIINEMLFADLLLQQNCEAEKTFTSFKDMTEQDLSNFQQKNIQDRKMNVVENVAVVVFSSDTPDSDSDTELLEALDGKFDALRDKLLAEALMKQLGETEWNRLSELERQRKLTELKLKERQLRRDGKLDELASILGDALEYQETLKKLLGDSKEEHERKMRERLERRKQRLAQGLTEEECDKLEEEDIAREEEEEKKRHKNILLELEHQYTKEKEELLRRLRDEDDRLVKERKRQIEVMKLKKQERQARKEDKFNSAALVLGLAEERERNRIEIQEEDRKRQEKLAKERIEAARHRRKEGKLLGEDQESINVDMEDKSSLQEALSVTVDKRHQLERDLLMEILDNGCDTPSHEMAKQMSQEEREDKLSELRELRKMWRQNSNRDKNDQLEILNESVGFQIESQLHRFQEEGNTRSAEDVKVQILSDLQQRQDEENRKLLSNLDEKDVDTLQQMVKAQKMVQDQGYHDNVSHVLLGESESKMAEGGDKEEEGDIVKALEEKYDALRDKILEATLIQDIGEDEWNRLSDKEKQKKLVELKMKEKRLRKDGKLKEAAEMFKNLLKNEEALEKILGDSDIIEEEDPEERRKKKEKLKQEREEQGLTVDDETLDQILDEEFKEESKKKRKNILENLQTMFDDEKAALLATLKNQKDRADQERQRQLAIAKLKRDKKRLEKEEKLDSAALILSMAKEADEKRKDNIAADRERQIALAKERLEARRKKRLSPENLEQNIKDNIEAEKLQDIQDLQNNTGVHTALLETLERRQEDERNMLMELLLQVRDDPSLTKAAKQKNPEELKMELSKLEQERTKWRNKSQQLAMATNVETMSPEESTAYFKQVSDSRREQINILKQALVDRLELEERHMTSQNPDLSSEDVNKELQVSLLADLQERQSSENNVIQNLITQQDDNGLQRLKKVQRMATREGWYDSLAGMLFQISHGEQEDAADIENLNRMRADMEKQLQDEKEELINQLRRAARLGEDIDMDAELRNIERQQEAKRKVMEETLKRQQKMMQEKIQARKRANMDKEEEEIAALQVVLLAEAQKQQSDKQVQIERGRQGNLLQQRLEARRQARRQNVKDSTDEDRSSRPSTVDSKSSFGLTREKTVLNVEVSDDQKKEVFTKLVREQTNLHSKITAQQKQQEEMLQRRLDQRKGRLQTEAAQLFDIGERQKNKLQQSKKEEKERQMLGIKEKVTRARMDRERSRSPNTRIAALKEENSRKK